MSGERDEKSLRAELASQKPAPEIYLASAIVDGSPPVWPGSIVVKNDSDARRAVDEIKAGGADFIKVYDRIPGKAYFALADEARRQHIDFEGHVPDAVTAQQASAAGQRSMEHLQGIGLACSNKQPMLATALMRAQFFRDRLAIEAEAYGSVDAARCAALFAEFRQNQTWQVPTLTVRRMWGQLDNAKFRSDPRLAYIGKRSRERWRERTEPQQRRWDFKMFAMARAIFAAEERLVGALYRAGVPIMAGTDAMNPYCFPGFSLHDELGLMVESGMPALAALQSATLNPARFIGRTTELGTVVPGKVANLVLLRADPLGDIHNTAKVAAVWLRGQQYDRAALDRLLEQAKESAKR